MNVGKRSLLAIVLCGLAISLLWAWHVKRQIIRLTGAVITQNTDPRKQLPVAGAVVTAADGSEVTKTKSDATGLFNIFLRRQLLRGQRTVELHFRHAEYEPLDLTVPVSNKITVAELVAVPRRTQSDETGAEQTISNVTVRFSIKTATEVNVGSLVRSFEVGNQGNVPCNGQVLCSPDGKWRASRGSTTLDAGPANEFRNARASCIAGPCPFTQIDTTGLEHPGRTVVVSAVTWSDTATFLVEAEAVHPMVSDVVRNSYPLIFGDTLTFTLPPSAESISLQADMNGQTIFFPFGPDLILDWAKCDVRSNPDQTRVYRCELKPGYKWLKEGG